MPPNKKQPYITNFGRLSGARRFPPRFPQGRARILSNLPIPSGEVLCELGDPEIISYGNFPNSEGWHVDSIPIGPLARSGEAFVFITIHNLAGGDIVTVDVDSVSSPNVSGNWTLVRRKYWNALDTVVRYRSFVYRKYLTQDYEGSIDIDNNGQEIGVTAILLPLPPTCEASIVQVLLATEGSPPLGSPGVTSGSWDLPNDPGPNNIVFGFVGRSRDIAPPTFEPGEEFSEIGTDVSVVIVRGFTDDEYLTHFVEWKRNGEKTIDFETGPDAGFPHLIGFEVEAVAIS